MNVRTDKKMATRLAKDLKLHQGNLSGNRILITGKGGAGKTTLAATLCLMFARGDRRVLAVDQDPQQNLAFSLGYPQEKAGTIVPVSRDLDYIQEKVGARPGEDWGLLLNLNPDVSDVVDRFGIHIRKNVDLLVMGGVVQAATGCLCPENALLGSLVRYLNCRDDDVIVMDTQAGVEHFGRSITEGFRTAVVVTEPTFNSVQVAINASQLCWQMGMDHLHLMINKCHDQSDVRKTLDLLEGDFDSVHCVPYDPLLREQEPDVSPLLESGCKYMDAVEDLYAQLE